MTYLIFIICIIMIVSWSFYSYVAFKSYKLNTKFVERQIKFMDNQEIISKREVESHLTKIINHSEKLQKENKILQDTNLALKAELKEVCDMLIKKRPDMKEWVITNWKYLYQDEDNNSLWQWNAYTSR